MACLVTFAIALVSGPDVAIADPSDPDTVAEARSALAAIDRESAALEEQFNASATRLAEAQAERDSLAKDLEDQKAKVEQMRTTISQIINTSRQRDDLSLTVSFVSSDDPEGFLGQLAVYTSVQGTIEERLARYVSEQERLTNLQGEIDQKVATIQAETDKQKALLAEAEAKEARIQAILNRLTAAERAAVEGTTSTLPTNKTSSSSSSSSAATTTVNSAGASAAAMKIVAYVKAQVGKRYVYGGAGPNVFDCSGLTMAAFKQIGISLPHSASAQSRYGKAVSRSELLPGDLLFFYSPIGHVGVYVGGGMMVDARNSRVGVVFTGIMSGYNTARRLV
jgi:cell wall-associated NlpC family hydrolase